MSVVTPVVIAVDVKVLLIIVDVEGTIDETINVVALVSVVALVTSVDVSVLVIVEVVDGTIDVTMNVVELISIVEV